MTAEDAGNGRYSAVVRQMVKTLMNTIAIVFFRSIEVVNADQLDLGGPVIFVGNHNNQFVDAMMMNYCVPRSHSYLIAAKSFNLRFIGFIANALRSIPVKRTQDTCKRGAGTVYCALSGDMPTTTIKGVGTNFKSLLSAGDSIKVQGNVDPLRITLVVSDTELEVAAEIREPFTEAPWKAYEKIDQHEMYSRVWQALAEDRAIAIFPEGGSHDRPDILPLKAGVCLMALGAMANYDFERPIKIVPVGINYFNGHRFQSRAVVEFGEPVIVEQSLVDVYEKNKREACATLLSGIELALRNVIITADDYKTLKFIRLGRRLYFGHAWRGELSAFLEVDRLLAQHWKDTDEKQHAEAADMFQAMRSYADKLEKLNLSDKDVAKMNHVSPSVAVELLLFRCFSGSAFLLAGLPGTLLVLPMGGVAKIVSTLKRREAVAGSEVKLKGTDVIASWKILTCLTFLPVLMITYPVVLFFYVLASRTLLERILYTLVFALIWPVFGIISCKIFYYGIRTLQSLRYLRPVALNDHRRFRRLVTDRIALEKRLRAALDEAFPELRAIREAGEVRLSDDYSRQSNPFRGGDLISNALGKGTQHVASAVGTGIDQMTGRVLEQLHSLTTKHNSAEDLRIPNVDRRRSRQKDSISQLAQAAMQAPMNNEAKKTE